MFIVATEKQKELYYKAKELVLQRKEELLSTLNYQKKILNDTKEQYDLAYLIIETTENNSNFEPFYKRQKQLIKAIDDKKFFEGAEENIKLAEERLNEMNYVVETYFTEKQQGDDFLYNEDGITFGVILEAIS